MNETLKRTISGSIYVLLLIAAIQFSNNENSISFFLLFGIFLLITVFEFCNLLQINKITPLILASTIYLLNYKIAISNSLADGYFYQLHYNRINDQIILLITLIVSIKAIFFLFDAKKTALESFSKYIYLIGYIILPFIILTKIPFGKNGYNPKIIISIFILIWTNDTFAYIVGKSIGKNKLFEIISPKKTIEVFL